MEAGGNLLLISRGSYYYRYMIKDKKPCIVCGNPQVDRAHFKTRGAGAGWEPWEYTFLCRKHHQEQGNKGWPRFCEKYPQTLKELSDKGWKIVIIFNTKKLRRFDEC